MKEESLDLTSFEENPLFNCYTDNYLVHTINDKTHITQHFLDTEDEYIEFTKSVLFMQRDEEIEQNGAKGQFSTGQQPTP